MSLPLAPVLPETYPQAAFRGGIKCRCPRCGEGRLFRKWLKPVDRCAACGQDWSLQRADDFPAYVSILVTGHLLAPILIFLAARTELSVGAILAIVLPLTAIFMLGLLQPAKGAIIAAQWWFGLNGFTRERPAPVDSAGTP
ncbi:MAG: DUF983 domain-containing protein [Candidatus Andeanibacterium colombiense]|uniref:DUF983 domain-containing protein n=1 Tax=Candidatus Andeanibacterium colombiense TaxID=3121345 RepID=A0AAJ5XB84_9SPHN|nr:MAG: DUF983 domain-containing protein [Sphingomonadaceae bacterium]